MSQWSLLIAAGLLLSTQSPSFSKAQPHGVPHVRSAKINVKAKSLVQKTSEQSAAVQKQSSEPAEQKAQLDSVVREQPAVLEPDGNESEFNPPAGALYTDSDDVG